MACFLLIANAMPHIHLHFCHHVIDWLVSMSNKKTDHRNNRKPREPRSDVALMAIMERKGGPMRDRRLARPKEENRRLIRESMDD